MSHKRPRSRVTIMQDSVELALQERFQGRVALLCKSIPNGAFLQERCLGSIHWRFPTLGLVLGCLSDHGKVFLQSPRSLSPSFGSQTCEDRSKAYLLLVNTISWTTQQQQQQHLFVVLLGKAPLSRIGLKLPKPSWVTKLAQLPWLHFFFF